MSFCLDFTRSVRVVESAAYAIDLDRLLQRKITSPEPLREEVIEALPAVTAGTISSRNGVVELQRQGGNVICCYGIVFCAYALPKVGCDEFAIEFKDSTALFREIDTIRPEGH